MPTFTTGARRPGGWGMSYRVGDGVGTPPEMPTTAVRLPNGVQPKCWLSACFEHLSVFAMACLADFAVPLSIKAGAQRAEPGAEMEAANGATAPIERVSLGGTCTGSRDAMQSSASPTAIGDAAAAPAPSLL